MSSPAWFSDGGFHEWTVRGVVDHLTGVEALLAGWLPEDAAAPVTPNSASAHERSVARHLLAELGMDPELVDAATADPTTHDEVRAEHQRVVGAKGFGVPTLFFPDGECLFGPDLVVPPSGIDVRQCFA